MARETGVVKWFSVEKGYGFIRREEAEDVFVHHTAIEAEGFRTLREGERVEFEVGMGERGPRARAVRRVEEDEAAGTEPRGGDGDGGDPSGRRDRSDASGGSSAGNGGSPHGGEIGGRRSLAAQIRERLGRRFRGFGS